MALSVVINGARGKMGVEIANIVFDDDSLKLTGCIEQASHPDIGRDFGICIGKGPCGIPVSSSLEPGAGVLIDFSAPSSTRVLVDRAMQLRMPMVIGTTGLTKEDLDKAYAAAQVCPVLVSPNMSLGVNLLFAITSMVAAKLKDDFDIEIIEAHHRFKKDAPSGTAKRLGELAAEARGLAYDEVVRNGRSGISDTIRSKQEIGMHAVRGGDIVGDHTVLFAGQGERIELRHMAQSRSTLARGAVHAAKWLASRKPGFYSMKDVLDL